MESLGVEHCWLGSIIGLGGFILSYPGVGIIQRKTIYLYMSVLGENQGYQPTSLNSYGYKTIVIRIFWFWAVHKLDVCPWNLVDCHKMNVSFAQATLGSGENKKGKLEARSSIQCSTNS